MTIKRNPPIRSILVLLLYGVFILSPAASQQSSESRSAPSDIRTKRFKTRLERSYISKPLARRPRDLARANSRLTRFRSLEQRFDTQGKALLHQMFDRVQTKYPELFGNSSLDDYLDMFSTSGSEVHRKLRHRIYSLMIMYARVEETIKLSSTVKKILPDGSIILNTSIDFYELLWKPGGPYTTVHFSTRHREGDDDRYSLVVPFRVLTNSSFQMKITSEGNVLVSDSYKKLIHRARSVLKSARTDSHVELLQLARSRVLTKLYFRDLLYQAWFRPFSSNTSLSETLKKVVFLPPLYETGSTRRRTFQLFDENSQKRSYRLLKNIHKKISSTDEESIYPAEFSRLVQDLGNENVFINFEDHDVAPPEIGTHAGGWVTIDTNRKLSTGMRYREIRYHSKPLTKRHVLKKLLKVAEPGQDYHTPYTKRDYESELEYQDGYHMVDRLRIRMTRTVN